MKKALFLALIVALVMSTTVAFADTVTGTDPDLDGKFSAAHDVQVTATVNQMLELQIDTHTYSVTLDPGATDTVDVAVVARSNNLSTLTRAASGVFTGVGTPSIAMAWLAGATPGVAAIGERPYTDQYTIGAGWDVPAGNYTETVTYTLVEQ